MSYARWGEDGSQVYVYRSGDAFTCRECTLPPIIGADFVTETREGMHAHLRQHVAAGHEVPPGAFRRLEEEMRGGR